MANTLISGPAGGGKSSVLQVLAQGTGPLSVQIDFQQLFSALTGVVRDIAGRYPIRDALLVPFVDQVRIFAIREAVSAGHHVIATNSSGDPARRKLLMDLLSAGGEAAEEIVVDPGRSVVTARLSDPQTGELSDECSRAVSRWFDPSGSIRRR